MHAAAIRLLVAAALVAGGIGCTPASPREEESPPASAPPPVDSPGYFDERPSLAPAGRQLVESPPSQPPAERGRPEVQYPTRIATGAGGAVCASDVKAGRVVCTGDDDRGVRSAFDRPLSLAGLDRPLGVAIRGGQLLVGSLGRRSVEIFDVGARRHLGALGQGRNEFSMPSAIAVASDGTVAVADSREDVVKVYGPDGTLQRTLGGRGAADGQFVFPAAVAIDDARIIVGDQGNHRLQVFDRQGAWQRSVGAPVPTAITSTQDFRGRFSRIQGIALRGEETLVLDSYHSHVQVFGPDFVSRGFIGRQGDCPSCVALALDLAVDSRGRALVTDPERSRWVYVPVVPR